MRKVKSEEEESVDGESFYIGEIDPSTVDLTKIASVKRFLVAAAKHDLTVKVQVTQVFVSPVFFATNSKKGPAKGDVKKPSQEIECIFITATNLDDFAVQASWQDGQFKTALVGGPRSGHHPPKLFKQITKMMEEIARCLA